MTQPRRDGLDPDSYLPRHRGRGRADADLGSRLVTYVRHGAHPCPAPLLAEAFADYAALARHCWARQFNSAYPEDRKNGQSEGG